TSTLVTVAVCTRDRPGELAETLDALTREASEQVEVLVVDQSPAEDPALARRDDVRVIRDPGRGLSRARNVALAAVESRWIAFVDDDCTVAPGFGAALQAQLRAAGDADWLSGHVGGGDREDGGLPLVTTFPVPRPAVRQGRWVLPGSIGFGVMFVVRCATARALGGWDERLGPGVQPFPAADDMDFNHRLLRSGAKAVLTPEVRATHRQWRSPAELVDLNRGYSRAWAGFAAKQARTGHPATALWLWGWGLVDVLDMTKSALGRRSRLRARMAGAKLRGLAEGFAAGIGRRW
ncbi:MAG TPA: glycosyltransferase, partial [Thermoleophilaceae bacterium]|nr:glycosyltransferase [Thermoleophilaceae bacterium]